ncbi:MAG: AAA family ATPase [Microcystis sp. LE19-114.1B]|nr:AAA family ATPase [Microcystis sp. LE19-114.1B]
MSEQLIANLVGVFKPVPLPADSPFYVDLKAVRADADVCQDLGRKIIRSLPTDYTHQLYTGHRGGGKSTELLRLKKYLEQKNCFVVYFAADKDDIDPEDAQYTDILIACTRHLLEQLKQANSTPLKNWIKSRWQDLIDLALTEIKVEDVKLETGDLIKYFGKLSAAIRAIPSQRQEIRNKINPHTVTLLTALNEFIDNSKTVLDDSTKLVVIVDNLDRIVPIYRRDHKTNHDEIFLDRANQLKGLNCHLIYTIPISMAYSNRANDLRDIYDNDPMVLPMIMLRNLDRTINPDGMAKIKAIIEKRTQQFLPTKKLETDIFESQEVLERLCLMTGGHVRNLILLMQTALDHVDALPITAKAAQRAITQARDVYQRTVEHEQWKILAKVYLTNEIQNDEAHRKLLFNRCILQYAYFDADAELKSWYDVHPLITEIKEFKDAILSQPTPGGV